MCCIPTFIDVTDLLVKASFPQGWHPHLGKKSRGIKCTRCLCFECSREVCVCVNLSSHKHMNEQTSKFRLPVDTNKVCKLSNKMSFVCLSAYRALTPDGDWTRPETDCLQHSKETVLYIRITHLNRGNWGY